MRILIQNKKDERNLYKFLRKQGMCYSDGVDLFDDMPMAKKNHPNSSIIITIEEKIIYYDPVETMYNNEKEMYDDKDLIVWKKIRKSKKIIKNKGFFYTFIAGNTDWLPDEINLSDNFALFINGRFVKTTRTDIEGYKYLYFKLLN